jgi:hypothetical protein
MPDGFGELPEPALERAFKKADDELQVAYVEAYAPGVPDSQNDFMTSDEIRLMAWKFLLDGNTKNVDREHNNQQFGAGIVESFIARDGDPDFIAGAWGVGIHVADPITWSNIKTGYINGVSLDGDGERVPSARCVIPVIPRMRRDRLWLINAFAVVLLTLLGAAGEALGYDRMLKTNTVKRRVHSLFRQDCMLYDLIPTRRRRPGAVRRELRRSGCLGAGAADGAADLARQCPHADRPGR